MNRFRLVLLTLALGLAFTGCSGKKEQAEKPKEAATLPAEAVPEKPAAPQPSAQAAEEPEAKKQEAGPAVKAPAPKVAAAVEKVKTAEKAVEEKAVATVKAVEKKAVQAEKAIEKAIAGSGAGDAVAGADIFKKKCAPCHGPEGNGTPMAPALKASDWVKAASVDDITGVIKNGRVGKDKLYPKFFSPMPASKNMSESDLAALAAYMKSLN